MSLIVPPLLFSETLCDSGVDMGVTLFAVDMGVTHGRGKNRAKKNRAKSLRKRLAQRQRFA